MSDTIAAYTKSTNSYPGYINISNGDDGCVVIILRGDPVEVVGSCYVCGYSSDAGKPGRCTPGDDRCNNYCNMAPQKGPMQKAPLSCTQLLCGETVSLKLTNEEFKEFIAELAK